MYVYIHKQRDKLIYIHIIDDSNALLAGTDIRMSQSHAPSLSHMIRSQIGSHSSNSLAPTRVVFSVPHIQLDQKQVYCFNVQCLVIHLFKVLYP